MMIELRTQAGPLMVKAGPGFTFSGGPNSRKHLGGDGVSFCHCHMVTPATQAVNEDILAINPHPDLQAAIVVA